MTRPALVGIDTVEIMFSIADGMPGTYKFGGDRRGRVKVTHDRAWVSGSVARRSHATNARPLPADELTPAVLDMARDACAFVTPARGSLNPLRLAMQRIDMCRDFQSPVPVSDVLRLLARHPEPPRTKAHPVRCNGRYETVAVGNRSWGVRAYDKSLKGGRPGQLRVEAQLRRRRLTSEFARSNGGRISVLGDALPERLGALAHASFELTRWGSPIPLDVGAAVASLEWTPRRRQRLLGVLCDLSLGTYSVGSHHTRASDRRLIDEFHAHLIWVKAGTLQLDWESGEIVIT